ncbi:urocanate hydratase [Alkalihalobacillus xiaoxiensis]|uniref:urocanate hydratase n=1 Tax=Shouchella xiaoxiensis TaxID=766895 RepID=UPI00195E8826
MECVTIQAHRSPKGIEKTCKTWEIEALKRLLLNCLDPQIAQDRDQLIVYGGTGKAVRHQAAFNTIVTELETLAADETLLIQSGKPVGKFRTYTSFPRVVASSSMLVPSASNWQTFAELEAKGLTTYGQSTAAAWAYIGVQGILQTTFETMGEIAERHFLGTLQGRIVLTSGLGALGAAQPLSVTMHGGVAIVVEADQAKMWKAVDNNYCDVVAHTLTEAIRLAEEAIKKRQPLSIALHGHAGEVYTTCVERDWIPDIVTDQTAAHDLLNGYIPTGMSIKQANQLRMKKPKEYRALAGASIVAQVNAMRRLQEVGSVVFEYGNNLRWQAEQHGSADARFIHGFTAEYIRPLYSEGRGPCRWIALSGNPNDIYTIDAYILKHFKSDRRVIRWIECVQESIHFHGLPARACWLNYEERVLLAEAVNQMVAAGELEAPIAFTRDHSEGSSIAAPTRETEAMKDGSDAVADWPILNAMLNASGGASMVSVQHGGGVGIGLSIHSGMTAVADGSFSASKRLEQVMRADAGLNIIRHADAGYESARETVKTYGLKKPL